GPLRDPGRAARRPTRRLSPVLAPAPGLADRRPRAARAGRARGRPRHAGAPAPGRLPRRDVRRHALGRGPAGPRGDPSRRAAAAPSAALGEGACVPGGARRRRTRLGAERRGTERDSRLSAKGGQLGAREPVTPTTHLTRAGIGGSRASRGTAARAAGAPGG